MKTRRSVYWKKRLNALTPDAKQAKKLLNCLCAVISVATAYKGSKIHVSMDKYNGVWEGHIFNENRELVFWGGHFKEDPRNPGRAESNAWVSLLEDCLGIGECGKGFRLAAYLAIDDEGNMNENLAEVILPKEVDTVDKLHDWLATFPC